MSYEIETDEPTNSGSPANSFAGVNFQCRHIFTDGHRCASPTLRSPGGHEPFCYYHHTTRGAASRTRREPSTAATNNNRKAGFTLPLPEDRSSIQHSIGEVLRRIAANEIDSRRAGLLLYGLQIASLNLKHDRKTEDTAPEETVTEVTHDPDHGLLAPPAELHANQPLSSAQRFLMELGEVDELDDTNTEPAPTTRQSNPPQPAEPSLPANLRIDLQASAPSIHQKKKPTARVGSFVNNAGDHLISHTLTRAVPSAQRGLTSVFEMGTGGTLAVNSPAN